VVEASPDVMAGSWIAAGEKLLQVVDPRGAKVEAYVDEAGLQRLSAGSVGVFIPDAPERSRVACAAAVVDAVQLGELDQRAVASVYGGGIPAKQGADGRVLPLQPTFRVRLEDCDLSAAPGAEIAGVAVLHGERVSLAVQGWRRLVAIWQREAGF